MYKMRLQAQGLACSSNRAPQEAVACLAGRHALGTPKLLANARQRRREGRALRALCRAEKSGGPQQEDAGVLSWLRNAAQKLAAELRSRPTTSALVGNAGVPGTAALTLGFLLHVDAWGGLHWDSSDFLLGLKCSLPMLTLYTFEMLPNWTETVKRYYRQGEADQEQPATAALDEPAGSATAASAAAGGSVEPPVGMAGSRLEPRAPPAAADGGESTTASDSAAAQAEASAALAALGMGSGKRAPSLLVSLAKRQVEAVRENLGRHISVPEEVGLILAVQMAQEMLYRGIVLTTAVAWTIDRLYEAGADETVALGALTLATPQAGALLAAVACCVAAVGFEVQSALLPLRLVERSLRQAAEAQDPDAPPGEAPERRKRRSAIALRRMERNLGRLRERKLWDVGLSAVGRVVSFSSISTAFLLSGNLLAPYTAAVAGDALYSIYQRLQLPALERQEEEVVARLMALRDAARRAKASRLAALRPGGGGGGEGSGEAGEAEPPTEGGDAPPGGEP